MALLCVGEGLLADRHAPMKVALVGPCYPYRGGISHHNTCLARAFALQGDVHVVNFSRMYPRILFPGRTQYDESKQKIDFPSVRTLDSTNPVSWYTSARRLSAWQPGLALFQWWHPFFGPAYGVMARILRAAGIPRVLLAHNVFPHEASVMDRRLSLFAFKGMSAFLVQSRKDQTRLERLLPGAQVTQHRHPAYDKLFTDSESKSLTRADAKRALGIRGPVVLFFGYVRAYKGLGLLLRALPQVLQEVDCTVVVAGEFYEDRGQYDRLIRQLGIDSRVVVNDAYIPNERVPVFFQAADIVVQPYVSATASGISQLATTFCRPMIVTDVGGLAEVVQHGRTGYVVAANDSRALSNALVDFFTMKRGPSMQEAIRIDAARNEQNTWSSLAKSIVASCQGELADDVCS